MEFSTLYCFYANIFAFIFTEHACSGCGKTTFLDLLTGRRHKGTMQVAVVAMVTDQVVAYACKKNVIIAS